MEKIGITTTVPVEVLIAAGLKPVDLNNLFITSEAYGDYIELAEKDGFPSSSCAWIKGIYGACMEKGIRKVLGVMEGDCSNTGAMLEVLKTKGIEVIPFAYPSDRDKAKLGDEIRKLMQRLGVAGEAVESTRHRLNAARSLAKQLDEATYLDGKVAGFENHLFQVSLSDFNGDIESWEQEAKMLLAEEAAREPMKQRLRLGYIGVPPMTGDLYDFIESFDARIVYNEVQREFAFPRAWEAPDIVHQYHDYTYPYDLGFRLKEIQRQIRERRLDGMIHYTQAFCHKAIEDIVIKQAVAVPVLAVEGDKLNRLDARSKIRIEAFLDMLAEEAL